MTQPLCRWGVLGTANIARKNWKAMRVAGNSTLVAVGSRTRERAEAFISECQAEVAFPTRPDACGDYAGLLRREDIDAVYIPLPTGVRPEWVIRAAEAGKHILCEKPCAPTAAEFEKMLAACKANKVHFMDGVMFMHSARLPLLRSVLDDRANIGELRRITTQFSFSGGEEFHRGNIRVNSELEPLGCLGDLGWYNIRVALWIMKEQLPERVSGRILQQQAGVPIEFSGELFFPGGVSSAFYCSFITELQQWANLSGTTGVLRLDDFVLPFYGAEASFEWTQPIFNVKNCSFHMENHTRRYAVREYSEGKENSQEVNMIRNFSSQVLSRKLDASWSERALKTQKVLDACLESGRKDGAMVTIPLS